MDAIQSARSEAELDVFVDAIQSARSEAELDVFVDTIQSARSEAELDVFVDAIQSARSEAELDVFVDAIQSASPGLIHLIPHILHTYLSFGKLFSAIFALFECSSHVTGLYCLTVSADATITFNTMPSGFYFGLF